MELTLDRAVLKYAITTPGALCVTMHLVLQKLQWSVHSWEEMELVRNKYSLNTKYQNYSMQVPLHSAVLPMDKELGTLCWMT